MNPLIFIPSPRDIPAVKKHWHEIKYDKFIVKYKPQLMAYTEGKEFFMNHDEYTHFIICPDDLEVKPEHIDRIMEDSEQFPNHVISGICNIDETRPKVYAIQPLGCDFSREGPPSTNWYNEEDGNYKGVEMPDKVIFQVGHSGFCCEIIPRDVLERAKWHGATNDKRGNFDWQFSKDCHEMGVPILADTNVNILHRRIEQSEQAKKIRGSDGSEGYNVWLRDR